MSKRPMTDQEFLDKLAWEGPYEALVDYGLSEKDLDPNSELWPYAGMLATFSKSLEGALNAIKHKATDLGLDCEF